MKKLFASVLSVLTAASACAMPVFAADSADVYVTIADSAGALALAAQPLNVTDVDSDGALTINDALYAAHEAHYDGGAAAGYATSVTEYGLGMTKLWGAENGSGFGYYVNNASAWSLEDPIASGDYINAFVYTDLTAWSDTYCYFDAVSAETLTGIELTLTLSANGYDDAWNPIVVPVEGAVITIDGEATEWTTDAEGKVTMTFDEAGSFVLSAVSDSQILVPPVCKVTVSQDAQETTETSAETTTAAAATTTAATTTANAATTAAATTTAAASTTAASTTTAAKSGTTSPKTADSTGIYALGAAALTCAAALAVTRRRHDEK